jgi:uncharacterized alkaline shock family protein YloU
MKYKDYSIANQRTIDRIVTVKEWNDSSNIDSKINVKYGYVMPVFHGHIWNKSKQKLIDRFTY